MTLDKDRHSKKYKAFIIRLDKTQAKRLKRFAKMEDRSVTDVIRGFVEDHCVELSTD
jgi:hypothetical protein